MFGQPILGNGKNLALLTCYWSYRDRFSQASSFYPKLLKLCQNFGNDGYDVITLYFMVLAKNDDLVLIKCFMFIF